MSITIVSFPGSGRTWLRYALGLYLSYRAGRAIPQGWPQLLHPPGFSFCHDGTDGLPSDLAIAPTVALLRDPP